MSTDIKPGQIWKDRTGPAHIRITEVTPTHVGYIWMDDSTSPGLKGARYVDQFLQDYEPGTPATPAPLDPSKVKAGDTVTLESGTALVRDVVIETKSRGVGQFVFYTAENPDPLIPGTYYLVNHGAWTLTDHQPAPAQEYVPDLAHIRSAYVDARHDNDIITSQEAEAEFDRWLETHSVVDRLRAKKAVVDALGSTLTKHVSFPEFSEAADAVAKNLGIETS